MGLCRFNTDLALMPKAAQISEHLQLHLVAALVAVTLTTVF